MSGIAQHFLDGQLTFRERLAGNHRLLRQQVGMPAGRHGLTGLRVDEGIVREAGLEQNGGIIIVHESNHITRTTGPPAVGERDIAVEDVRAIQHRLNLLDIRGQRSVCIPQLPQFSVQHGAQGLLRLV